VEPAEYVGTESGTEREKAGSEEPALTMVAGARYAQRCPVEFGVPMEVVIGA